MNSIKYKIFGFICSSIFAMSCTEPIDFNQVEALVVTPELEASFIHFNEPATRFLVNGVEVSRSQDFVDIELFRSQFTANRLKRVELVFETQNTINRAFTLTIDFIDRANTIQHRFSIQENASTDDTDTVSTYIEVFENQDLAALKQTVRIAYTLRMLDGEPIKTTTLGRVECKSYAAFQINLIE